MFLLWFPTLRSLLYPKNALYKNLNTGYALKNRLISVLLAPGFFFLTGIVSLQTEMYGKRNSDRSDRKVYRREELCANWIIY